MKDELSKTPMRCPSCFEMVETIPAEDVPNQSLRGCPECEHVWLVDIASIPAPRFGIDAGRVITIDGTPSCYISIMDKPNGGGYAMIPAHCDNLAHRIVELLNKYDWSPQ